jgi:heptosyltransferase-2
VVEIGSILHKPIMLLGGKDVFEEGEQVVSQLGERATNGCGKYSLYQSAAILQHADCVITGDTGLMHIAAALHKPTAAIFGATIPEYGTTPTCPASGICSATSRSARSTVARVRSSAVPSAAASISSA